MVYLNYKIKSVTIYFYHYSGAIKFIYKIKLNLIINIFRVD